MAFARLLSIEAENAFAGFASQRSDDPREERLSHEYVLGITRWRRWLDFLINSFYSGKEDGLELKLRIILRIGFYDVLFMSTPDHAAVNETVELAKRELRAGAGSLANALLRSLIRSRGKLPTPSMQNRAAGLGTKYSHPDWIVKRWIERYGEAETVKLLEWNNERPEYAIRRNSLKGSSLELTTALSGLDVSFREGHSPDFVNVSELSSVLRSAEFLSGLMSVQDEAAGLVVRILDPQPGETILDVCAAPGGKAMYAAERMGNVGRVVAIDRHEGRLRLVKESAVRLGCSIVETEVADATKPLSIVGADRVLVDAPCSGLGVLSKRADLRWRMTEGRIVELVALQSAILDAAAASVRVGGVLVYSTCTTEPEENEVQVGQFLERHPEFEIVSASIGADDRFTLPSGFYQSLPHVHGMDGAFAAKMLRVR